MNYTNERRKKRADPIDRQAAIDALIEWYGCKPNDIEAFEEIIDAVPPVDAVPVVRCKDCVYFSEPNSFSGRCTLRGDYIFTNDFCSYAVMRRNTHG